MREMHPDLGDGHWALRNNRLASWAMVKIELGEVIDQRFRVTGLIGQGGMGYVYLGQDLVRGQEVAHGRRDRDRAARSR